MTTELIMGEPEALHEKLLRLLPEAMPFSMKEIQESILPNESYWPLYRALQKLEKDRKILFYKTIEKRKYYERARVNDLPHIVSNDGKAYPLSLFVESIEGMYDFDREFWKQLNDNEVNQVPLYFAQLFVIAQRSKTPQELKKNWESIRLSIMNARRAMSTAISWIDNVMEHPSMNGDMEKFKTAFAGKDAPSDSEILAYLVKVGRPTDA